MNHSTGKESVYGGAGIPIRWLRIARTVTILALLLTITVIWFFINNKHDATWRHLFSTLWVAWVVVPPLWFSFEYFSLFKKHGETGAFEAFKYGQELASRAWLSIAAVMSVVGAEIFK